MIDGKLKSEECQPSDVQVIIESSGAMALHDEGRGFLAIPVEDLTSDSNDISLSNHDVPSDSMSGELETYVPLCNKQTTTLKEMSSLKITTRHESKRYGITAVNVLHDKIAR